MIDTVWVQATRTDGRVALWEKHQQHPGGEAFVFGREAFEVALTDAVRAKLERCELVLAEPRADGAIRQSRLLTCWRLPNDHAVPMGQIRVDILATLPHYLDHIAPVVHALGPAAGRVFLPEAMAGEAERHGLVPERDPARPRRGLRTVTLVASYADARQVASGRPVILMEHGAGQTYRDARSAAYSGGRGVERNVILFLAPGERCAAEWRRAHHDIPAVAVGCPKLDAWHVRPSKPRTDPPTMALTWHWPAGAMVPEADWALPHFAGAIPALTERYRVLGHGHPRVIEQLAPWYQSLGIEVVKDLSDVFERADVLLADNTSAMYEFAVLDRPVVALNAPHYRRDVQHGLRFWDAVPGVQCDEPGALVAAVETALVDAPEHAGARREAVAVAYGVVDDQAARRAAGAILDALGQRWPVELTATAASAAD